MVPHQSSFQINDVFAPVSPIAGIKGAVRVIDCDVEKVVLTRSLRVVVPKFDMNQIVSLRLADICRQQSPPVR